MADWPGTVIQEDSIPQSGRPIAQPQAAAPAAPAAAPEPASQFPGEEIASDPQPVEAWQKGKLDQNGIPLDLQSAPQSTSGAMVLANGGPSGLIEAAAGSGAAPAVSIGDDGRVTVKNPDGTSDDYIDRKTYAQELFRRKYGADPYDQKYVDAYTNYFGAPPSLEVDVAGEGPKAADPRDTAFGKADTFIRGGANTLTAGLADDAQAAFDTLLGNRTFLENVRRHHNINDADWQNRPGYQIAGDITGALLLPSGAGGAAEKAASIARAEALASGATIADAEAVARVASRKALGTRLAAEGGAYGGVSGATAADRPEDILPGALAGVTTGALAGKGFAQFNRLLPAVEAAGRGVSGGIDLGRKIIASITKEGAADSASNFLGSAASRPVDDVLAAIAGRETPTAGVQPTLAEVATDPGVAGFQRGYGNTNMEAAAALGDRHASNALARSSAASDVLGTESPQSLQDFGSRSLSSAENLTAAQRAEREAQVSSRIEGAQSAAITGGRDAAASFAGAQDAIAPVSDRTATGAAARIAFNEAYTAAKARTREAYEAPILKKPQPINIPRSVFTSLRDAADDFYGDGGGEIPQRLQSIISDMAEVKTTTRTLTNIDRRLADFAGESRMSGRALEAAFAERVRGTLNDFVQKAAPKDYRDALASAKAVRAEQGNKFETGNASSAFATDRYGAPVVGDTTIPSKIVRPGAAGGDTIDGLISAIGPEASERAAREELRRAIEEGGVNSASKMDSIATRFGEVAKRFPKLESDIATLRGHAASLDAAKVAESDASRLSPTSADKASIAERSALHDQILASPLGKVADPAVDPSAYVGSLLRRSDGGRQLRYLATQVSGDAPALNGLRRSYGDYILDAGKGPNFTAAGEQVPSISKTRAAIANVVTRAGDTLKPEQKIVLQKIRRELESANFAATASKPAGSETAINRSFDDLINTPFLPGKAKSILQTLYSVLGNGQQVKQLITQALLDPDFAATLLKRPTAQHWQQVQRKFVVPSINPKGLVAEAPDILGLQRSLANAFAGSSPLRAAADQNPEEAGVVNGQAPQNQPQYEGAQP